MSKLPGVVAAEADSENMYLYFHSGSSFRVEKRPFTPYFIAAEELEGAERLAGNLPLCWKVPGETAPKGTTAFNFRELRSAAMISSGIRLFENMTFDELRRMQFQVIAGEYGIEKICCSDNSGWQQEFSGEEPEIISAFTAAVQTRDPDVLEGYDFFRNDWELLKLRAKKHKIKLLCGREGKEISSSRSSVVIGERRINYTRFECHGRHLIDIFLLVQLHDSSKREMESFDFGYAVEYFDLKTASPVQQMGELSALLAPAYFYCTRFIPASFQSVALRGNGSKIDLLLTGAYLEQNHSLPLPDGAVFFPGATSKAELAGRFAPVWHCDVRSLYPSILMAESLAPAKDELRLFPELLGELRQKRLDAKDMAKRSSGSEKNYWNALQYALKIVINSFYGYLGFAQGSFNDYTLASKVTAEGRNILALLTGFLSDSGAQVIEMDTDGVYFSPPSGVSPEDLEKKLQSVLPSGIEIELDAIYPAMFSYKAKNYALLTEDGKIELTGAALKSRGMERYFRNVLKEILRLLLEEKTDLIEAFHQQCLRDIAEHKIPLKDLCKNETLNDTPANYRKKLDSGTSRRSAVYELLLAAGAEGRVGDKVEFYITGTKAKVSVVENSRLLTSNRGERDENIQWYSARLDELFKNFS